MNARPRKLLKLLNQTLYLMSIAMLISGLVLTVVASPVAAATGSVWTTDSTCGAQDKNQYNEGEAIWYRYNSDLINGNYSWKLAYTNDDDNPIATGTFSVPGSAANNCYFAANVPSGSTNPLKFTILNSSGGKVKSDNLTVLAAPTATTPAPTTPAPTTPAPTTPASTTPAPTTPAPTTPAPTTPAPTTPAPTTPAPTTPAPTTVTPDPTTVTPDPTTVTPDPTEVTPTATNPAPTPMPPTPTATNPAPTPMPPTPTNPAPTATDPVVTEVPETSTVVPTLPIPATGGMVLIPVTGADVSNTFAGTGAARSLFLSGFSFFGVAMVISGLRRKFDL